MRKMKKRILAWMMVLAMLLSMVPEFGTYASEDVPDTPYDVSEDVTTEAATEVDDCLEDEFTTAVTTEQTTETVEEAEDIVDEECTEDNMEENTEVITEDNTPLLSELEDADEEILLEPGDAWIVIGKASPSIYISGRGNVVGSQYTIQSVADGSIIGGWCYDHNKTTAAIGSGLTEAVGTNKFVAMSCLVAQGNGAMATFNAGFDFQGNNPEVVATLANSILAGNSAGGSFGSVVDNYVAYIRSLDAYFTMLHPSPSFTNNDASLSYDSTSGLYYSKTMKLNVAEDGSNNLTWEADTVLPTGVYAKVTSVENTPINISGSFVPGQTVSMKSNQYITYMFDTNKISTNRMSAFSQSFTLLQYVVDAKTFTPHGGYQPVIYASYSTRDASVQMGDVIRGRLGFQKRSSNTTVTTGCGLYSLAGAEYVLNDENGNPAPFIVASSDSGDVYRSTSNKKFVTNASGWLTYTFTYNGNKSDITALYSNVSGNNPYTITFDSKNRIYCDMGTYRLSETKASPGYKKDEDCRYDTAGKYHEVVLSNTHPNAYITCREEPHLDPIQVRMVKRDQETGELNPIGAGSLAGAVFEVDYYNGKYTKANLPSKPTRKWYFETDENGYWNFLSGKTLNNDKYHSDEMYPGNQLPLGTVTIREITAPEGYLRTWDGSNGYITIDGNEYSDNKLVLYQILMNEGNTAPQLLLDGTTVSTGNQVITIRAYDPVERGNLSFDKKEYNSDNNMPYMAFILESTTTHEKHIIVTDENGHATTDFSSFGNRRENVNGNDKYLDDLENLDVIGNKLRPTPVWFYGTSDESKWDVTKIQTNRGALPFDTYTITEIASDGNSHTRLIDYGEITFEIKGNREMVNQTVYDMELPVIHTTALSEDTSDHIAGAYKTAKVIDTVEYENLYPEKTYKLVGTAMNQKTGKPISLDGKPIVQEVEFTTSSAERLCHDYQDVVFEFDATLLRGTTMVVFEKLYLWDEQSGDWIYVTGHEDIDDEGQSVHFTDVRTTATDSNTNSHDSYAVREVTIIDKVFCSNLIKGRTYTVKGMIMVIPDEVDGADNELNDYTYTYDESTGTYTDQNGIECHPYLVDGKPVTAEKTFVADHSGDCIVELAFTFDARPLKNRSINVFEDLYNENGIRIGTHADLTDEDQTIIFHPKDTSILVNTRNKIDGFGRVKTGDIPIIIFIILLLSSAIAAACIFVIRHKALMTGLVKKVKVTVSNHKMHMLLLLVMMTVSSGLIVATGAYASNNAVTVNEDVTVGDKVYDYQLITIYDSDKPDTYYDFEKKYNGAKLMDTSYDVVLTLYPEKTVTTEKTYKQLENKDERKITDTITKDGVVYHLKDVSWEEVPVNEEVEYTLDFGYCTSEPDYPGIYEYTYQSPTTGEEVTAKLPFVRLNKGTPSWVDGFSADVTFKNLEGELFTLGNHTFVYGDNLSLTEEDYTELVRMLGFDTSLYRLNGFSWNGTAYENEEGELCRKGIATGQQYATRYSAYYADTVETGKNYNAKATYEAQIQDKEGTPTYTIQASALYQNTGIWSNIINFVVNHKTFSGIFVFIILGLGILAGIFLFKKLKLVEKQDE